MQNPMYIRIRGRVLGPYDQEKLQALAQRGQFSRLHEVSEDGVGWVKASTYPELFVSKKVTVREANAQTEDRQGTNANEYQLEAHDDSGDSQTPQDRWYYVSGGSECGPVPFAQIQHLIRTLQLTGDDQVWTEGMSSWKLARDVPGLIAETTAGNRQVPEVASVAVSRTDAGEQLTEGVIRALVGSRGWVLFVSVMLFLWAAMSLIGSVGSFIRAGQIKLGSSIFIASGLSSFITAVLVGIAGCMLSNYASRIAEVAYRRTSPSLERALESARVFWMFVGILMIVVLAFVVVALIWVFAVAGELAS